MSYRLRLMHVSVWLLTCAIGILSTVSQGATRYHLTDIGAFPLHPYEFTFSEAYGLNDQGDVVGLSLVLREGTEELTRVPFIWTSDVGLQQIGEVSSQGFNGNYATGINNSRQVVGYLHDASPFVWSSSTGINSLGGVASSAYDAAAINDAGQVVGTRNGHAFLWSSSGGMQDLGDLAGFPNASRAADINSSGAVVGAANANSIAMRAFTWTSSTGMQALEPNGSTSEAFGVNDLGDVVGHKRIGFPERRHAFLWSSGIMRDLGSMPGGVYNNTIAYGVNESGQVIGYGSASSSQPTYVSEDFVVNDERAFIWTDGDGMRDLNSQLGSSGTDWLLRRATAINASGQIAGFGFMPTGRNAFLLSPYELGDLNNDGVADFGDIEAFEVALTNPDAYVANWNAPFWEERGDINNDGFFDFGDIMPFEILMVGGDPLGQSMPFSSVPEASTSVLLGLAGVALFAFSRRRRS